MTRAPEAAAVLLAAALALLLPSLVTTDTPAGIGLAVATLALASMVRFRVFAGALSARPSTPAYATGCEAPPALPGRVTDPVHHPLRPRAPGTV
jgi:hypothetical protein